jgi:predicted restriction endonuclease
MKFPGDCIICKQKIRINEIGYWAKGLGVIHEKCYSKLDSRLKIVKTQSIIEPKIEIPKKFLVDFEINESQLKILENPKEIETAQNILIKIMTSNVTKQSKIRRGLKNKNPKKVKEKKIKNIKISNDELHPFDPFTAFWIKPHNLWWAYKKLENVPNPRYQNLFGADEPKWEEKKSVYRNHPVCEVNPSLFGSSKVIGAFVSDNDGNTYLATKGIGGVHGFGEHRKIIESIFSKKSKSYSIQRSEGKQELYLISKLNYDEALSQISFFIQNIQNLKKQFDEILTNKPLKYLKDIIDKKMSQENDISSTHTKENETLDDFSDNGSDSLVYSRGTVQGKFRELLLEEYDGKCTFCGFNEPEYLIGAHIVPHEKMLKDEPENVGNPIDGLLLCRLCDNAFEIGDIKLDENYNIIKSQKLINSNNPSVNSWISKINEKIIIKSDAKYAPSLEYIRKKLKLVS